MSEPIGRYRDTKTGRDIVVWPWDTELIKKIKDNQERYEKLYTEG